MLTILASAPLCHSLPPQTGFWETASQIAMVFIAVFDILLTVFIFKQDRKKSSEQDLNHRKFELIHSLILNDNLHRLYEFYDNINNECSVLLQEDDKAIKKQVDLKIKALLANFRLNFIMLFNVIDPTIYQEMLTTADDIVDQIVNNLYDDGINIKYPPKYNEVITQPISKNRNAMIAILYRLASVNDK